MDEEEGQDLGEKMDDDFELGQDFRENLIPLALEYYLEVIEHSDDEDDDDDSDHDDDSDVSTLSYNLDRMLKSPSLKVKKAKKVAKMKNSATNSDLINIIISYLSIIGDSKEHDMVRATLK